MNEPSVRDRLNKLAYNLNRHHLSDLPFTVAGMVTLLILALATRLPCTPGGWGATLLLLLLALAMGAVGIAGRLAGYVRFLPADPSTTSDLPSPLPPTGKLEHRASGWFEVHDRRRYMVEVRAWFRTFETLEHAVMAYKPASRFLLAEWPASDVGMWYVFFSASDVQQIEFGQVRFGSDARPGLRITYERQNEEDVKTKTLLLSFDSEADRQQVYANLLARQE